MGLYRERGSRLETNRGRGEHRSAIRGSVFCAVAEYVAVGVYGHSAENRTRDCDIGDRPTRFEYLVADTDVRRDVRTQGM